MNDDSEHKREILAERNLFRDYITNIQDKLAEKNAEIASLRELVGEMAIALSGSLDIVGNVSEYLSLDCGTALRVETYREILAKAREVVKL